MKIKLFILSILLMPALFGSDEKTPLLNQFSSSSSSSQQSADQQMDPRPDRRDIENQARDEQPNQQQHPQIASARPHRNVNVCRFIGRSVLGMSLGIVSLIMLPFLLTTEENPFLSTTKEHPLVKPMGVALCLLGFYASYKLGKGLRRDCGLPD